MRISGKEKQAYPWWIRLVLWLQKRKYGQSLLPILLWGRSPRLFYGVQTFYRALDRKSSPIDPALRALICVRISQINHCAFCVDINSSLLEERGVSLEKAAAVANFSEDALFSDKEQLALHYAEAVTVTGRQIDDALFERLKGHFSEDAIVELTGLIAFQNLSSKFNAALDVPAQGFCTKKD